MKKIFTYFVVFINILLPSISEATKQNNVGELCKKLKFGTKPIAYLIDKNGKVSDGPLDIGSIPIKDNFEKEGYQLNTGYKVIVSPESLMVRNPIPGSIYYTELLKTKSICAESATYNVVTKWNLRFGLGRPFQFKDNFPDFYIEDEYGNEQDILNLYKFKPIIYGVLINPK